MIRPVLFALLLALPLAAADTDTEQSNAMKRLADVLAIAQDNAVEPVNLDQAYYGGAIPGLLRHHDPHSSLFDPDQIEQQNQMERSTSKGFGTVASILPGRVTVLQTLPDTPAARAGIAPGDEIRGVNNYSLAPLEPEQINQLLTASRQKPVELAVRHPGALRLVELRLVPKEMQSPRRFRFRFSSTASRRARRRL